MLSQNLRLKLYPFKNYIKNINHGIFFSSVHLMLCPFFITTVDPVYSERVSAAKKCSLATGIHYKHI
jgi:hypothetical protein